MPLVGRIAWHPGLSVSDDGIDADHQLLLAIINDFRKSPNREQAEAAARRLYQYSVEHFAREEALQRAIGYPRAEQHRREHARLAARLQSLVIDHFIRGQRRDHAALVAELGQLMEDWLLRHIMTSDKAMTPHLRTADPALLAGRGTIAGGFVETAGGADDGSQSGDGFVETVEPAPSANPPVDWEEAAEPVPDAEPGTLAPPSRTEGTDSEIDLAAIVAAHREWLESGGRSGRRAVLEGADLSRRAFSDTVLANASLRRCDLSGCDFTGADLGGADLRGSDLTGASLTGVNLAVANLRHTRMAGSDLTGAKLDGADLAGADLGGASLVAAGLKRANLVGANLSGAKLTGASGLTRAQLRDAVLDARTSLPPGFARSAEDG